MKVFLAVTSLHGRYGGPAFSVSQLAGALANIGIEVGLWAPDGSAATSDLVPSVVTRLRAGAVSAVTQFAPDIIHDNGIWLAHNHALASAAARSAIPRLVSTRGMLEPWALEHKRFKKRLAWRAYQRRDLQRATAIHATSRAEAGNLATMRLSPDIHTIPNGVAAPTVANPARQRAAMTALFLGRLYPVKGLPMLIEAWAQVRPDGWRLRLAGPDEAGHRGDLEALVREFGLGGAIEFVGAVKGSEKDRALGDADLFILPSHSESFGMVVGEALAHGLPVLTTTAVPWPALESEGCGWRVPPTTDSLAQGLRTATSTAYESLAAMGARGRSLVAGQFSWSAVADQMTSLYQSLRVRL